MEIFAIKIIDKNIFESCGMPSGQGEIQIKEFKETFDMPVYFWNIKDYQKQWQEGIERIKTHDTSCLIAAIQDPNQAPLANLWVLYKEDNKVYIQNHILFGEIFSEMLKQQPFNAQTCYNFISEREIVCPDSGMKISEWEISLEAITATKI